MDPFSFETTSIILQNNILSIGTITDSGCHGQV